MKIVKLISLLLAMAMLFCACGNDGQAADVQQTEPTAPAGATTAEELTEMLQTGRGVLGADLDLTAEIQVKNQILDGGGYTITGPKVQKEEVDGEQKTVATTENALTVTGGTVENLTIKGQYRAIGDRKGAGPTSDVRLKNITVDGGSSYALNFGYANTGVSLFVEDSTLCGWSSYNKFETAMFTNCTFAWSENGQEGGFRPYVNTTLVGCKFEGKTEADGTVTPFSISFRESIEGVTLTLEDCYVGDTLITQENVSQLLNVKLYSNTIRVQNSN